MKKLKHSSSTQKTTKINVVVLTILSIVFSNFLQSMAYSQNSTQQPIGIAKLSQAENQMMYIQGESVVQWFRLRGKISDTKKSVDNQADVLRQLSTTSKYLFHERWQANSQEQQSQLLKTRVDGSISNYVEAVKTQKSVYSSVWPSERNWFVINENQPITNVGCFYSDVEGANLQFFGNAGLSSVLSSADQMNEFPGEVDGEKIYTIEAKIKNGDVTTKYYVTIAGKDGVDIKKKSITSMIDKNKILEEFFVFYTPVSFIQYKGRRVPQKYAKTQWLRMNGEVTLLELTVGFLLSLEEGKFNYWRQPLGAIISSPDAQKPTFVGADTSLYANTLASSEISPEVVALVLQNFKEVKEEKTQ